MKHDPISAIEANLRLQAEGLLTLERENRAYAEARGELAQDLLTDRIRGNSGRTLELQVLNIGWQCMQIQQVYKDHFIATIESKIWFIKFSSLGSIKNLANLTRRPNRIEQHWNLASTLRDWMIDRSIITLGTKNQEMINGEIHKIFKDNLELFDNQTRFAIPFEIISFGVKKYEG